ncbi:MAG: DNRLRE domain-containing protein [Bacteroidales bacterium]|nr:DNRLRE domain-containing protein [Bacteroidales bacterium]
MKKICFFLAMALVGLFVTTSCSNEFEPDTMDKSSRLDESSRGVLRDLLMLQPYNNTEEFHITTFPDGLPGQGYPVGWWGWTMAHRRNHQLSFGYWTNSGYKQRAETAIKFDLSRLRAGDVIKKATLRLYSIPTPVEAHYGTANTGSNNAFYISRITNAWTSSSTGVYPVVETTGRVLVPHTSQGSLNVTVDVTAMVKRMITNGNYGFLFRFQDGKPYTSRYFCNSGYPDPSMRPSLTIEFN